MTDAERMKRARERVGLTQQQLADRINTTAQNISQYERGIRRPRYQTMIKIASSLGTTVNSIWENEDQNDTDEEYSKALKDTINVLQLTASSFNQAILNYASQLSFRNKGKALTYIADLLDAQKLQTDHPEESTSPEVEKILKP